MNEKHMSKTQLKLINTAGPLFAEDGLKGTRIRSITEAAGVNVAGINYHFGGKEKLYSAVAQYVFDKINYTTFGTFWKQLPQKDHIKENISPFIRSCLKDTFTKFFKSNHPLWYFKIVQRIIMQHDQGDIYYCPEMHELDYLALKEIFEIVGIEANECNIDAWLAIWYGHTMSLSILVPNQIVLHGSTISNYLTENYIDALFENTCIAMTSLLKPRSKMVSTKQQLI